MRFILTCFISAFLISGLFTECEQSNNKFPVQPGSPPVAVPDPPKQLKYPTVIKAESCGCDDTLVNYYISDNDVLLTTRYTIYFKAKRGAFAIGDTLELVIKHRQADTTK